MAQESTAVSLEAFSLGFASVCCFFYGILGVVTVCTTSCWSTDGDQYSGAVKMSPILASFYCSVVLIMGYIIWKFRYSAEGVSTFFQNTSLLHGGSRTVEGHMYTTMSVRLFLSLVFLLTVVVILAKVILLGPLERCVSVDQSSAPFLFSVRVTMKKMELWVVGLGIFLVFVSLVFNWSEKMSIEEKAKAEGVKETYSQQHLAAVAPAQVPQPGSYFVPGGYTVKPGFSQPVYSLPASQPFISQATWEAPGQPFANAYSARADAPAAKSHAPSPAKPPAKPPAPSPAKPPFTSARAATNSPRGPGRPAASATSPTASATSSASSRSSPTSTPKPSRYSARRRRSSFSPKGHR